MRKLIYAAAAIVATSASVCSADNDTQPILSPAFRQTTTSDGLPTSRVFSVIQDSKGYIWAATQNGLARYDGYKTHVFLHSGSDPSSISGNTIRGMFVDNEGRMWIGVYNGTLDLYKPRTATFLHYSPNPDTSDSAIWTIKGTGHYLWIGTIGQGLYLFNTTTKQFTHFLHNPKNPNTIASNRINNIYISTHGTVWLATTNGLDSYNPGSHSFTHHLLGDTKTDPYIWDIAPDSTGTMWVATSHGLYFGKPELGFKRAFPTNKALNMKEIRTLLFQNNNELWIGSFGEGVWLLNIKNHTLSHFVHDPSVPSSLINDHVWDIYQDRQGTIWITTDLGISRLVKNAMQISLFTNFRQNGKSIPIGQITGLYSNKNTLYIATSQGSVIAHIKNNKLDTKRINSQWIEATSLDRHRPDSAWIGSGSGNILEVTNSRRIIHSYHVTHNNHNIGDIDAIYDDGKYLWIGTFDFGLFQFDPITGHSLHYRLPIHNDLWNRINELRRHDNELLIGTSSGLALLDIATQKVRILTNPPGIKGPYSVIAIDKFDEDTYFLGTTDGLIKLRFSLNDSMPVLTPVPGLSGVNAYPIMGLEQTNNGNLWISTDYGLLRYNPDSGKIDHFSLNQGLPFPMFTLRAHAQTNNNRLWFGGPFGLISFIPSKLHSTMASQHVVINSITYYLSNVAHEESGSNAAGITLSHNANIVQFEFSSLNYIYPAGSLYRYRLLGLENEWIPLGTRHIVTLSNLPPKHYTLQLETSDNPGFPNAIATSFDFSILPPWWRTWWAYLIYSLLILGTMFAYVYTQQRKLRREREISARLRDADVIKSRFVEELESQVSKATSELRNTLEAVNLKNQELEIANKRASEGEQLKSQFLASMSHELRTPLTAIQGYLKLLSETPISTIQTDYLRTIQNSSESLLAIINDSLDLSRIESGKLLIDEVDFDIKDLIEGTIHLLGPSAYAKNINLIRIIPPDLPINLRGDPLRIRQILTNLIGNAIKFTQSGSVCVRIQEIERRDKEVLLGVAVSDTGIGIPKDAIKRLFEAYTRHESRSHAGIEGTGLGLSICKKLLDLMGGEIDVMSTPGIGSTFEFRVAFKLGKRATSASEKSPKFKIGLLDKHPLSRQAWQASLSRLQFDVVNLGSSLHLKDVDTSALVLVLGLDDLDKLGSISRNLGKRIPPHIVIAPTNDPEMLANIGRLFNCAALSGLATEASLNQELLHILPSAPEVSQVAIELVQQQSIAKEKSDHEQKVILVADDNAINRKLLVTLLIQHGFRVAEAASGIELLELAKNQAWDLAFIDIHMPEMDGIETTQKLLSTLTEPYPPIIAISADALPETRANALAAGIQEFLVKPYSESQLLELLQRFLKT